MNKKKIKKASNDIEKKRSKKKRVLKSKVTPLQKFLSAIFNFLTDLDCAKDMFEIVTPILADQDKKRVKDFNKSFTSIKKTLKKQKYKIFSKINDMVDIIKKVNRADSFFRGHSLVCLLSSYERYLSSILSLAFAKNPQRVTNQTKSLTYDELLGLDSLDNLIEAFAAKEIDQLLHDSHSNQIKYIDAEFKLGIKDHFPYYPDFIELTERRNLIVHNGGIINKLYLKKCKDVGYKIPPEITAGKALSVDNTYFINSLNCLYELGIRIGYALAVRLYPESKEEILLHMHEEAAFEFLCKSNWELSKRIYLFGLSWPDKFKPREELRRYYIINAALSCFQLNQKNQGNNLLDNEDWSSQSEKFKFAVAILKKDWKLAQKIMNTFTKDKPFLEEDYREYPIFRKFITTEEFKSSFRKIYHKSFTIKSDKISNDELKKIEKEVKTRQDKGASA